VPGLPGELLHLRDVLGIHGDTDHHDLRVFLLERRDLGNLLDARHAPGRPEVEDHPTALVVGEPVAMPLGVGDVEGGSRQGRNHEARHDHP